MSLKSFHIVFIVCSIVLAGWFASWAYNSYQFSKASMDLIMAGGSAAISAGLVVYLVWFLKKKIKTGQS